MKYMGLIAVVHFHVNASCALHAATGIRTAVYLVLWQCLTWGVNAMALQLQMMVPSCRCCILS